MSARTLQPITTSTPEGFHPSTREPHQRAADESQCPLGETGGLLSLRAAAARRLISVDAERLVLMEELAELYDAKPRLGEVQQRHVQTARLAADVYRLDAEVTELSRLLAMSSPAAREYLRRFGAH